MNKITFSVLLLAATLPAFVAAQDVPATVAPTPPADRSPDRDRSLVDNLKCRLSELEAVVLQGYLEGRSYEAIAEGVGCDSKTVDNALQRVKRKVSEHLDSRKVID